MTGFFLKKAFFDGWDNLFTLALMNVGFILIAVPGILLPGAFAASAWIVPASMIFSLVAGALWWSACVHALKAVADFGSVKFADMLPALRKALIPGLQLGGILSGLWFVLVVGLPFYLERGGIFGIMAAGILFWFALVLFLALQYYLPLRARLGGGFRKNIRKSLILFFDNPWFSIMLFMYNSGTFVLSFFMAFLMPGLAGIALALDDALRLRLYKYDWIEANPSASRRSPPWDELLKEDRELVGKRSLKGMIFPWKE
jgi:hypothetical protein